MIGRLTGSVDGVEPDGALLLTVGGVGYEVHVPLGTEGRLIKDERGHATVHVHTHAREDQLSLFGFASAVEKETFRTLLHLSGVGPKLALAVLGGIAVLELAEAVERADAKVLTRIPGVGKRTAERMLVDLKGKLGPLALEARAMMPREPQATASPRDLKGQGALVADALVRMGFKPGEVDRALAGVADLDRPLGELVRDALALLSR